MTPRASGILRRLRGDDAGSILIVATLMLTIVIFAAALAVDIGGRVQQLRRDQATADLAALDASRDLATDTATLLLAQKSALRNRVDSTIPGNTVSATRGTVTNGTFTAGGANTAVKVTVGTPYNDFFGGGSASLSAAAVATMVGQAQFSIGSTLVETNVGLGRFGEAQIDAVGYNGLASGTVTLDDLATKLGFSGLSADQVLGSSVSVGDLVQASAALLNANNPTAASSLTALFGSLSSSLTVSGATKVTVGKALGLQQGQGVALGTNVNLLHAFRGALQIANQKAGLTLNVGVPNVTSLTLTGMVPATTSIYGPIGITATNTQVTLTFNLAILVSGVLSATLPITLTAGGATGTLHAIDCTGNTVNDIKIGTTFQSVVLTIPPTNVTLLNVLNLPIGSLVAAGTINVDYTSPSSDTTVNKPANWASNPAGTPAHAVAGNPGGSVSANLTGLGALVSAFVTAVNPLAIVTGTTGSFGNYGINVGPSADLLGIRADCGGLPRLIK